ncbi:MAG: MFS transporter permease, partial [Rhodospirillaceae bacterium]|nr:MFS transporter permease [Rhodospirillaceae bacterium]
RTIALAAFAVVAYPLLAPAVGRPWPQAELFGVAPDPTAVATLGIVLAAARGGGWALIALPLAWCLVSGLTLLAMKSPEALVPVAAALLAIVLASVKRRR